MTCNAATGWYPPGVTQGRQLPGLPAVNELLRLCGREGDTESAFKVGVPIGANWYVHHCYMSFGAIRFANCMWSRR